MNLYAVTDGPGDHSRPAGRPHPEGSERRTDSRPDAEVTQEVLTLAYFGGYTQAQTAALLGLPLGTVKTRIRNALVGLREALGSDT